MATHPAPRLTPAVTARGSAPLTSETQRRAGPEPLTTDVRAIADIPASLRERMYALYDRYYAHTNRDRFEGDLAVKDRAILLLENGALRGFSTLAVSAVQMPGRGSVRAVFSGDTIVDHRFWGQQALAFTWIRLAGRIAADAPDTPLYWFLIVKGHRTYRYLHAFTRRYYPHWQHSTPDQDAALMHALAKQRFGAAYCPDTGVVHFPRSLGQLREPWAAVTEKEQVRPEVAYFLHRNPGFGSGDELVCLTRLDGANLRPLARRLFQQGFKA